jgi:hypothetical protein
MYDPDNVIVTTYNDPIKNVTSPFLPGTAIVNQWVIRDASTNESTVLASYDGTEKTVYHPVNDNTASIYITNFGDIYFGQFRQNNEYDIMVNYRDYEPIPFTLFINLGNVPPPPPPPKPVENVAYIPSYDILKYGKENSIKIEGLLPATSYLESWGINDANNLPYTDRDTFNLSSPLTGHISVNNLGTITYGGFNRNTNYDPINYPDNPAPFNVFVRMLNVQDLLTFKIIVQDVTPEPPPPPPPVNIEGYDPNSVTIKSRVDTQTVSLSILQPGTFLTTSFSVNGVQQKVNVPFRENGGSIVVENNGDLTFQGFINKRTYNILTYTNVSSTPFPFTLIVQGEDVLPLPYYYPNSVYSIVGEKDAEEEMSNYSPSVYVKTFSVTIGSDMSTTSMKNVNERYEDNGGYIMVNDVGKVIWGGFTQENIYNIVVNTEIVNEETINYDVHFLINVTKTPPAPVVDLKYVPSSVDVEIKGSNSSVLTGIIGSRPTINYFTVNSVDVKEDRYKVGDTAKVGSGTIKVDALGTVSYGGFDKVGIYNVTVNLTKDGIVKNVPLTINVVKKSDDGDKKKPFYKEWWFYLIIAIVVLIIISIIIYAVVASQKKKKEANYAAYPGYPGVTTPYTDDLSGSTF